MNHFYAFGKILRLLRGALKLAVLRYSAKYNHHQRERETNNQAS